MLDSGLVKHSTRCGVDGERIGIKFSLFFQALLLWLFYRASGALKAHSFQQAMAILHVFKIFVCSCNITVHSTGSSFP